MLVNIALLPYYDGMFIQASREEAFNGTLFTLNSIDRIPHLTLCQFDMGNERFPELREAVKAAAKETNIFDLEIKRHPQGCYQLKDRYLDIEFEPTEELAKLQEKIMQIARNDCTFLSYQFRPHVTLTRFISSKQTPRSHISDALFCRKFESVGIFQMGDHGTCVRALSCFLLKEEKDV